MKISLLCPRLLVIACSVACSVVCSPGCGGPSAPKYVSGLPADYATTFKQVRPCRSSTEHNLDNVTVFTDDAAYIPYTGRMEPFPTGAVVVKPEYDIDDTDCSGNIIQWTVMVKLDNGTSPLTNDWRWQRIFADKKVVTQDDRNCINCHADCTDYGYAFTCSAPPAPGQ
ncbi:MAG: cytochrome P460 family protein [Polyangia bacterium]